MKKIILSLFLFFIFIFSASSQIDTLSLLKKVMNIYPSYLNGYLEYTTNIGVDEHESFIKKKVWFVKDKSLKNIISLRLEKYNQTDKQAKSISILNEKQKYYISPLYRRSDLCTFNFLKGEALDNFFLKMEEESFPSFMVLEDDANTIAENIINELRSHENLFFELLNDTVINGVSCFGIKFTDYDKNNGYIPDITGKGNEKYADKKTVITYYDKKEFTTILKVVKYNYTNPELEKLLFEQVNTQTFNDKQNTNLHLYTIKTDSLRNYFQTLTKFNGNAFVPEIGEYTSKKASTFNGLTLDNKSFKLNELKSKYILLGFWTSDCYDCFLQMHAMNEQFEELQALGLTFIAVNSSEKFDKPMKEFIEGKNYKFQIVFSEQAGNIFQTNKNIMYVLLDKELSFKEIYYDLNQDILNKIIKRIK